MDFTSAEEVITLGDTGPQYQVQLWKVPDGKAAKSFNLPHPQRSSTRPGPLVPVTAALSPGRRYLAVAIQEPSDQPGQLVLMALADGKVVGSLGGGQGVCRGLSFSPDGAELRAVYSHQPRGQQREARLLAWSMKDGKSSVNVDLANVYASRAPLPGPDPDTVLLRGRLAEGSEVPYGEVIDRASGITLYPLPFTPVRWLGDNGLLGYQPAVNRHTGSTVPAYVFQKREVRNVAFDRNDYQGKARVARAAVAPRPEASPGDRTAVRSLRPEPGPWAVPADPGKALAVQSGATRLELGQVLFAGPPGEHAAVLLLQNHAQPRPRQALLWSRYDLRSGRPIGEPRPLWPWIKKGTDHGTRLPVWAPEQPQQAPLLGSLQGDGSHLAVRDTANPDRVDVWTAAGKRVVGLLPYGKGTEVEWLGWAGERLLTLGAGKLTAWEVPKGRAVYEVEGGYKGLAALSPGRAWVAVSAAEHLDVLEVGTGACLGRLPGGDVSSGPWAGLSASFDGLRLAGVRAQAPPNERRNIHVWDLKSGQARSSFPIAPGLVDAVHWCGSDHLLLGRKELVSLPLQTTVLTFNTLLNPTPGTLDGRLWCVATDAVRIGDRADKAPPSTGTLVACTVPGPRATPELPGPSPAPWQVVYHAGMTVKVEIDLGDRERNEAAESVLAGKLRQAGFTVGEGDWKLVLHVAEQDSQTKLTSKLGAEVAVPEVRGELRLVAPDGSVAAALPQGLHFYAFKTRYRQFQEVGVRGTTTHYDFGGRNPHAAMVEEVWEHWMKGLPRLKWPHGLVKHDGKYEPLPLTRPLEPDAAGP